MVATVNKVQCLEKESSRHLILAFPSRGRNSGILCLINKDLATLKQVQGDMYYRIMMNYLASCHSETLRGIK